MSRLIYIASNMPFRQLNGEILKDFFFGELVQKCLIIRK